MQAKVKRYWTKYLNILKLSHSGVQLEELYKKPSETKQQIWGEICRDQTMLRGKLLTVITSNTHTFTAAFVYKHGNIARLKLYTPGCTYDEQLSDEQLHELHSAVYPASLFNDLTGKQFVDYLASCNIL